MAKGDLKKAPKAWINRGLELGKAERDLGWEIGEWWNSGEPYGDRVKIVKATSWKGPSYETCRRYGKVAKKFNVGRRLPNLSIHHHQAIEGLPPVRADRLLSKAKIFVEDSKRVPSVQTFKQWAKVEDRAEREIAMAERTLKASQKIGHQLYSVIMADPPWKFETWSENGRDRAPDNHYPTMPLADICALADKLPAAKDCVLFLWVTGSNIFKVTIPLLAAWDFEYRSQIVWTKPTPGTGRIVREAHELMLYCVRGTPPAPAMGQQPMSWFQAPRTRVHSEKPDRAYEIVEAMFPSQPKLEMFARKGRPGWDAWGNEAPAERAAA